MGIPADKKDGVVYDEKVSVQTGERAEKRAEK